MKRNGSVADDPVVAEVRAIRAKLWRAAGGTIEGFLESIKREAKPVRRSRRAPVRRSRRPGVAR